MLASGSCCLTIILMLMIPFLMVHIVKIMIIVTHTLTDIMEFIHEQITPHLSFMIMMTIVR